MTGFVPTFLEKKNRAHTKQEGLEPTKLPALPAPPKQAAKDADVVLGTGKGQARTLSEAVARVKAGGVIGVPPGEHEAGDPVDSKKPFTLIGAGAARSAIVFRPKGEDDCLALTAKGKWTLRGVALLAEVGPKAKGVCADLVGAHTGAEVELQGCVIAGAPARLEKDGSTSGGVGVRAYDGGQVQLRDSVVAFNHWNLAAHGGGAALRAADCQVFGATFGVFAGAGGSVGLEAGEVRRNRYGLKTFGKDAAVAARRTRIVDQTMNGVFAELGKVELERCTIEDNGAHGVGAGAGAEVSAKRCRVRENWESGFWIGGRAVLEDNDVADNAGHGISLGAQARGRVAKNRCKKNGGFGIVREPSAKVELAGNDTRDNERDGDYVLGTLEKALAGGFPKGARVPEALAKLARYQEQHGRLSGETLYVSPGPLAGWPGLEKEFAVFGSGPDGSTLAFWLHDGLGVDQAPIVYLDSEGSENLVLARTFQDFLAIFATGRDDLRWGDEIEPEIDDEDEHERFCAWLKEELGVTPAKKIDELRRAAAARHPKLHERLMSTLKARGG